MVAYNKYETAIEKLANKLIDALGTGGSTADVWNVVIHTDNPAPITDSILADLTQITGTNYTAGGQSVGFTSSRTAAPNKIDAVGTDVVWTAGGTWPAAQFVTMYDVTATNALWCWWDYQSTFTLASGETFTVDFGATIWSLA